MCALVRDPSLKAECVLTFAHESERGPFVRDVEKRDEKAVWNSAVAVTF